MMSFLNQEEMQWRLNSSHNVALFLPGRIVYFAKKKRSDRSKFHCPHSLFINHYSHPENDKCCEADAVGKYYLREAIAEEFSEIEVSSSMAMDHFPDRYFHVIRQFHQSTLSSPNVV